MIPLPGVIPEPINIVGIFAGAVASMILGMLWYSPVMFGKQWLLYRGIKSKADMDKMKKATSPTMYAAPFIGFLLMGLAIALFMPLKIYATIPLGAFVGGALALGFILPLELQAIVFGGKPTGMAAIDFAYNLVCAMILGITVAIL